MWIVLRFVLVLFFLQDLQARERDPDSVVANVSTIDGDYCACEVDLTVGGPDSLTLYRYYSSQDTASQAPLGGWRFLPHCFLSVEPQGVVVGTSDGTFLTYTGGPNIFYPEHKGLANTARGNISSWTNQKNNRLSFDPSSETFELQLSSLGKRVYVKHPLLDIYCLIEETLPSGNKVVYEYDPHGRICFLKATNGQKTKTFGWIKIEYGDRVHVETSEGKSVDYSFQDLLLTEVTRSDQPSVRYQYQTKDGHALDRMQDRGLTPSLIENTIKTHIGIPNKIPGRMQFYDPINNISIVTENGEIVTVVYGRLGK